VTPTRKVKRNLMYDRFKPLVEQMYDDSEERLLELKAVVELLRRVMRDSTARVWLRTPNPDLDYEKPLDLIGQGRFREVISLVLAIAEGVTA
jgi:uncharacterized protein (DUF2384 family)